MSRVYLVAAKRTPIGRYKGALRYLSAQKLASGVTRAALTQSQVPAEAVDELLLGQALPAGQGQGVARQVALAAGLPETMPASSVSMVCGSSLKAMMHAYAQIKAQLNDVVVVAGVESMSQAPLLSSAKDSQGISLSPQLDATNHWQIDGLTDAFSHQAMGELEQIQADRRGLSRQAQDQFALESYRKAQRAQSLNLFDDEIAPVIDYEDQTIILDSDEGIDAVANLDTLEAMRPVFSQTGTITAGNASSLNDGASALVLASQAAVDRYQLTPLAEVMNFGQTGLDPAQMGLGPVSAIRQLLISTELSLTNIDWLEINEAFAAQTLAVLEDLAAEHGLVYEDLAQKTNPHGGAIALGHPIGASGGRIVTTLTYQLQRQASRYGIASLCIGGGMGLAVLLRRV